MSEKACPKCGKGCVACFNAGRSWTKNVEDAAREVLHEFDLWAEDANDGEFAIWSRDRFMGAFLKLQLAFNALEGEAE